MRRNVNACEWFVMQEHVNASCECEACDALSLPVGVVSAGGGKGGGWLHVSGMRVVASVVGRWSAAPTRRAERRERLGRAAELPRICANLCESVRIRVRIVCEYVRIRANTCEYV